MNGITYVFLRVSLIEYHKLKSQLDIDVDHDGILRTREAGLYIEVAQTRHVVHEEQTLVLKVKISVESDARWIYLIYGKRGESTKPWILLEITDQLLYTYIYIYRNVNRVKCNQYFVKYQIYTVSNLSTVFLSARFLHDISNKHLEN